MGLRKMGIVIASAATIALGLGAAQPVSAWSGPQVTQLLARATIGTSSAMKYQTYLRVAELTSQQAESEATRGWYLARRGDQAGAAAALAEARRLSAEAAQYYRLAEELRQATYQNALSSVRLLR